MPINHSHGQIADERAAQSYEAGPTGYGFYGQLTQAGFHSHWLNNYQSPVPSHQAGSEGAVGRHEGSRKHWLLWSQDGKGG